MAFLLTMFLLLDAFLRPVLAVFSGVVAALSGLTCLGFACDGGVTGTLLFLAVICFTGRRLRRSSSRTDFPSTFC